MLIAHDDSVLEPTLHAHTEKLERPAAKYVIRMAPGPFYLPGTIPLGIGEPLQGLAKVARAFEERFPDTKISLEAVPITREYLVTQLSSGLAPDIIMANVPDVWVDIQKGWYLPLDDYLDAPNPFIREKGNPALPGYDHWWDMFKYQNISRGKVAPDGHYYCISYDMVETAVFYNKTIFDQLGLAAPSSWHEFIQTMQTIKDAGYVPLLMNLINYTDWAVDLFLDQLYHPLLSGIDLVQDTIRERHEPGRLEADELAFLYEKGFFTSQDPRYVEMWRILHEIRPFCNQDLINPDLLRPFINQEAVMMWNITAITHRLVTDTQLGFEWGIFYLPPLTGDTSRFASNPPLPMCVIGGSANQYEITNSAFADSGDPASSERLKRVIAFLQFMCVPEYYEKIVNEHVCFLPNIIGIEPLPPLKPFEPILERRYTMIKLAYSFDLRFIEIMQRMFGLYIDNAISLEEFLSWQDANFNAAVENLRLRKNIDRRRLEQGWQEHAQARIELYELPHVD